MIETERPIILIAEDHGPTCIFLVELLEPEGYAVEVVADGEAALARVADGGIGLVLLDMQLPSGSGVTVIEALAAQGSAVPIVAMSASPHELTLALAGGVRAVVEKPFDLDELLSVTAQYCAH